MKRLAYFIILFTTTLIFILPAYSVEFEEFLNFSRLDPNAIKYVEEGLKYLDKGDLEKAISDYNECIRLEPEKKGYYYTRGLLYYNNREIYDLDLAKKDLYRACELGYDHACYILSDFWPE